MSILKPNDFLLYSTGTALAYKIAKEYYNNVHYVWCTEAFDAALQPGTSNPRTLCSRYLEQIQKNDRHANEIKNNKAGILKGALAKLDERIINDDQFREIQARVAYAGNDEFYPVIYMINKRAVKKRLIVVNPEDKASDSSIEYIIKDLKRNEFDLIRIRDVLAGIMYPIDD